MWSLSRMCASARFSTIHTVAHAILRMRASAPHRPLLSRKYPLHKLRRVYGRKVMASLTVYRGQSKSTVLSFNSSLRPKGRTSSISCKRWSSTYGIADCKHLLEDPGTHYSVLLSRAPRISPLIPARSKCSVTAKRKLRAQLDMENSAEVEKEEEVGGCRLRHNELLNGDIIIHYVECGNPCGDLVVLIHGFPNFWYAWKNQFQELAQAGYHVIAPDLRGYNTSSKPKVVASYGRQPVLSDIVCLIDHLGAGKPAMVVGHDWGGAVTWALAEDYPDKLRKIVVVNSPHSTVFSNALHSSFQQILRSWYFFFFQLRTVPEFLVRFSRYWALRKVLQHGACQPFSAIDIERHVVAFSMPGAVESTINYYRAAYSGLWGLKQPHQIGIPVAVIWGELDQYLGRELAHPPEAIAPKASLTFLAKCSHWPMWDNPNDFNELLLSLLAKDVHHDEGVTKANQKTCPQLLDSEES